MCEFLKDVDQLVYRHDALYSKHGGRHVGTFGAASVFSMWKTLPVPNGGALLVNDAALGVPDKQPKAPPFRKSAARLKDLGFEVDDAELGKGDTTLDANGQLNVSVPMAARPTRHQPLRVQVEATVTDADLVLGYLDPNYFLGGRMNLDLDGAKAALDALARDGLPGQHAVALEQRGN